MSVDQSATPADSGRTGAQPSAPEPIAQLTRSAASATVDPKHLPHMSMGSPSEIKNDSARALPREAAASQPDREYSAPETTAEVLQAFKAGGVPREVVAGVVAYMEHGTRHTEDELSAIDAQGREAAGVELTRCWGAKNVEAKKASINSYLATLPASAREVLERARDPKTGAALLNDPAMLVRLAGLAAKPRAGSSTAPATLAEIENFMRKNRFAYNKDEAMQARYRALLDENHFEARARSAAPRRALHEVKRAG